MKLFISSDHHFSHRNIIEYCNRPFSDAWEMGVHMSNEWNLRVSNDDIVLHLGDVTLINKPDKYANTIELIKNLKGRKILVYGNHDHKRMLPLYKQWGWLVLDEIIAGDVLLTHIPPSVMPKDIGLVLHGHSHATLRREGYIDVGVDAQPNYAPVDLATLISAERFNAITEKVNSLWTSKLS